MHFVGCSSDLVLKDVYAFRSNFFPVGLLWSNLVKDHLKFNLLYAVGYMQCAVRWSAFPLFSPCISLWFHFLNLESRLMEMFQYRWIQLNG